jgi:uncharacterized protein
VAGCSFPENNAGDRELMEILKNSKSIAVVGISHKVERDSHRVARYLQRHGYKVIPVNPKYKEVLGERCYPNLKAVPEHIDVVDIFRNVKAIPGIVDEAIEVGASSVWMQLGLAHNEAAEKACISGLKVVMDRCIKIEHQRLIEDR